MAEDERHRIVKRANEGRAAAHKRGTQFGRKPKLTDHQQGPQADGRRRELPRDRQDVWGTPRDSGKVGSLGAVPMVNVPATKARQVIDGASFGPDPTR
jgi:DNA invertase Pin-like site-specific DNA recombinase